ncbi:DNA ligase 4-like [Mya arenaria]|uniref:DNA ligase 4-like n=1 Tax=Mya arenaria TaxID=6604 RepID=UPI0022DFEF94|nr:DNA ligase 4-like [Mya arenaria]
MDAADQGPKSPTVASKVHFAELCGLLEKISKTQGNDKKKKILKDFVGQWRKSHETLHGKDAQTTDSFHPAMRLLLPHLEKERIAYGIKEHMFAKLLIEVLCLGKDSQDAQRLLNFKSPKSAKADVGDFASVVYFVLQSRCPSRGSLFIEEVNDCLDGIATNNAAKKKDIVRKHIVRLITNMSALELKWLTRMIVKELKIGLSQASVLSVFHPDAEEFYNVNNNLEKVCRMMHDPSVRIHEIGITVFSPFTPMLGERASPDKVDKLMEGKPYYIETKFDGERMVLHKDGGDYKFYSRSGNEHTGVFGSNQFDGNLVPYIHNIFKPDLQSCIMDGEMILYHPETKTYATKAMNTDVKTVNKDGFQPCLHVFDIMLYNGRVLTNLPLRERLPFLEKAFTPCEGRMIISQHRDARTNQDCADALNEAIDGREEGIMVKNPESVYRPNTRKGGWFKVKPEYVGGLMDELDVLVVGGYFGVGHRAGMMSHFLCAVAVPPTDGDKPELFYSFCKIGSGYSKKELRDFNAKLVDHWQAFDKKNPPRCIELASGFKEKPDAWIDPSKSAIVQIKAAEIIDSERFRCGFTLRFPRVEKFRDDKHWYECMTFEEVKELKQKSGGKLAGGYVELGGEEEPVKKKRKVVSRAVRPTLGSQFRAADTSDVKQVSKLLEGKELCVINGPSGLNKQQLETKIVECGGTVIQNPGAETYCVIVEKVNFRVSSMIKSNRYDIVRAEWLIRCFDANTLKPWSPDDMVHATGATKRLFDRDYDDFGDSYVEDTTPERLQSVMAKIDVKSKDTLDNFEIAKLEDEHFPDESPYGLFRTCKIYLDNCAIVDDPTTHIKDSSLDLLALELRFFGASVSRRFSNDVSHVMVDLSDKSRVAKLKKVRGGRQRKFHIVTEEWVRECMEEGNIVNERAFEPGLDS